jgi:hypothetical protein
MDNSSCINNAFKYKAKKVLQITAKSAKVKPTSLNGVILRDSNSSQVGQASSPSP